MCAIEPGLSDREFATIEAEFGIEFSDDHRVFLAAGLPVNTQPEPRDPNASYGWDRPWPDWRNGDRDELRRQLDWPINGVLSDVEHGLWLHEWGARPTDAANALTIAQEQLAKVPKLIPIYAHRFLPAPLSLSGTNSWSETYDRAQADDRRPDRSRDLHRLRDS